MEKICYALLPPVLGFLIDCVLGDPYGFPHPVIFIGKWISKCEKWLRKRFPADKKGERAAGTLLVLAVTVVSALIPAVILTLCGRIHPLLYLAAATVMCWQILAAKCLKDEAVKIHHALTCESLERARYQVSMIVGRDTSVLDETGVAKAAIESVAESTSDGVVAPLFYLFIGGPVLGFLYKSINTMDSMVGYKNDKYRYFGTAAARLDDAANFIPARLSGLFMVCAAWISGFDGKNAWKIFRRDRKKHASPNSAHTESACAGALDIQLAGDAVYFGELHKKPFLGDGIRPVEADDILRSCRLMYATSVLALVLFALARFAVDVATEGWIC